METEALSQSLELFSSIRALHKLFETGFLGAYCGLYKIKVHNNEDPEGCFRVAGARKAFLAMELDTFKELTGAIHSVLKESGKWEGSEA